MNFVLKSLVLFAAVVFATAVTEQYPTWEEYKVEFRKFYSNPSEDALRKAIYEKNLETIMDHNRKFDAGTVSYSMGVNKFTDWTKEELNRLLGTRVTLSAQSNDEKTYPTWEEYKKSFNKNYPNPAEDMFRKHLYENNVKMVMEHNVKYSKGETSFTMGINDFSDWTEQEFNQMLGARVNAAILTDEEYPTWEEYKNKFGKSYPDPTEDAFRKNLYMKNLKMVIDHNELYKAGKVTWTMGVNQFSDLTESEKKNFLGFLNIYAKTSHENYPTWEEFKKTFGKTYSDPKEDASRKNIYEGHLKLIMQHNEKYAKGESSYEMGVNKFCDWTEEEIKQFHFGLLPKKQNDASWEQYKKMFGKHYSNPSEDALRKGIFEKNRKLVEEHNKLYAAGKVTWKMELNKFSDFTVDEIKQMLGFRKTNLKSSSSDNKYPTWEEYKKLYGKNYPDPEEDNRRKGLYEKTLKTVIEHNKKYATGEYTWEMGINNFADWTVDEEKHLMGVSKTSLAKINYPSWDEYKKSFGKSYSNLAEDSSRRQIYENNLEKVLENNAKYNKGEISFKMGVNQFSDWTKEELKNLYGFVAPKK